MLYVSFFLKAKIAAPTANAKTKISKFLDEVDDAIYKVTPTINNPTKIIFMLSRSILFYNYHAESLKSCRQNKFAFDWRSSSDGT